MTDNLIAVDIGNTNVTVGVFRGDRLAGKAKVRTDSRDAYIPGIKTLMRTRGIPHDARRIIISSVAPKALRRIKGAFTRMGYRDISVLGEDIGVPIKNLYAKPAQVGQDRLVNAFGARELYGVPALVIDFGTAVTFDCVSRRGEYLGGLIMPGTRLALDALYEKTALLPKIQLRPTDHIIGTSTADSMRAGILFGLGAACDGLVARYRKLFGSSLKVIATGGDSGLVCRHSTSIQILDEDLTLKGLRLVRDHQRAERSL